MTPENRIFRIPVKSAAGTKRAAEKTAADAASVHDDGATDDVLSGGSEALRDYVREAHSGAVDWQAVALHLQADAQSYRQRQSLRDAQRLAEERERLLLPFLEVVDNLERTLAAAEQTATLQDTPLYRGVEVTYREMRNLLEREGVTEMAALGAPFDPAVHEAVAVIPGTAAQGAESLVVAEVRRGYRQGERVLRPARVIVAQFAS